MLYVYYIHVLAYMYYKNLFIYGIVINVTYELIFLFLVQINCIKKIISIIVIYMAIPRQIG